TCMVRGVDVVTARALAPLPKLLSMASPWMSEGAFALFHKGAQWKEELTAAAARWTFVSQAIPGRSGGSGIILKLSGVSHD
ncbi:MAG: 16S rRNA (guanine(527)-N(7))-methyltransferase RsmG, partial [Pseudomonadota bacterium]